MSSKKNWTKGTKKEKVYQPTLALEQKDFDSAISAIEGMKLCTDAIVADRMKCGVSVARRVIAIALEKNLIKPVITSSSLKLYTTTSTKKVEKTEQAQKTTKKGKK